MLELFIAHFVKKSQDAPWLIGSHRGRLYADNAAALYEFIVRRTNQKVIWIASSKKLLQQMKE